VLHLDRTSRITDVNVHIQPWRGLKPQVQEAMRKGKESHWEFLLSLMDDPRALLDVMDRAGVWRVGLVNYPSPDVMGFDDSTNAFAAKYAQADPERLLAYGGVNARYTLDPAGDGARRRRHRFPRFAPRDGPRRAAAIHGGSLFHPATS